MEQKEFETLEKTIEDNEARVFELESIFSGGAADKDGSLKREYSTIKENLEVFYQRWEELASKA